MDQARARAVHAPAAVRRVGEPAWTAPSRRRGGHHRRSPGESGGSHGPPVGADQPGGVVSNLSRRANTCGPQRRAHGRGRPMKILYVCHRFPFPPKRGGKIRPFNVTKHLARTHDVTVASLVRSTEEARAGEGLAAYCKTYIMERVWNPAAVVRMLGRLPTRTPSSMGFFYSPQLARRITEEVTSAAYDLILVHCSSVAPYVQHVRRTPKILDFGDMDSQKWLAYAAVKPFPLSLGYRLEGLKMQRAEIDLARRFDCCTCTTRAELATLDGFGTGVPS